MLERRRVLGGYLKPGGENRPDAQASPTTPTSAPTSFLEAFHAGIAAGPTPTPAEDLRAPGKPPDLGALLPHLGLEGAATTAKRAPSERATGTASAMSPDVTEQLAAMKASAFNLELEVLRHSTDPNAKYKVQDVLERADDSLTRKKMKEQYAATNPGQTIDSMIQGSERLGERDKKHALDLMSDRRDAVTDKLAAMDPEARAKLEDNHVAAEERPLARFFRGLGWDPVSQSVGRDALGSVLRYGSVSSPSGV